MKKNYTMKRHLLTVSFLVIGLLAGCMSPSPTDKKEQVSSAEETETTEGETEAGLSEEEYKNSCQDFDYKEYFRNDRKYTGEKIRADITVGQVIEGDCRGYDDSGNEYYVKDLREDEDKFRLLKDDRITVYGEYAGVGQVTRAIGSYKEDIFCIDARYMVLHEEGGAQGNGGGQEEAGLSAFNAQQLEGSWWDTWSQRCDMTVEYLGDNRFGIMINWSGGAADMAQWTMTGYYDDTTGQLNYSDGRMDNLHYEENGDESSETIYTDGTGYFYMSYGYLYWIDEKGHAGDDCCFEKAENSGGYGYGYEDEDSSTEYVCPDSSSRLLTEDDLWGMSAQQLRIARNEIYARHGRIFTSEDLQNYFNACSWYVGTIPASQFSESLLNDIEKKNVAFLQKMQDQREEDSTGYRERGLAIEYPEAVPQLPGTYHYDDQKGNSAQLTVDDNGYFVTVQAGGASNGKSWYLESVNDQAFWNDGRSGDEDSVSIGFENYGRVMIFANDTTGEKYWMPFAGRD